MSFLVQQSTDKQSIDITLAGALTVHRAGEMKKALLQSILDADDVSVRFDQVQEADLSCFQMLCSAHRSAVRFNKRLHFSGELPRLFIEAAEAAGFSRLKGCKLDCEQSCLWMTVAGVPHG